MSLFCLYFFHDFGLNCECFDEKVCNKLHNHFFNKRKICPKLLFCLPIIGQIGGLLFLKEGCLLATSDHYHERVHGYSCIVRGLLTFLGLGIFFLLIDIIITILAFIKDRFCS